MPLLCVDFDGTIWDGVVLPGAIARLTELRQKYWIGIFSARKTEAERSQMKHILDSEGVPYDEILGIKPDAVAFVDDKGIHFEGWESLCL